MHSSSYRLMAAAVERWAGDLPRPRRVLDVGSLDVNGTYKALFAGDHYTGCDLTPGPNVDVVVPEPYRLPFVDGQFHLVVSGQTLEHSPQPWRLLREMARVTAPGGYVIAINPSTGPAHMTPDCYRFLPDGMRGLAEWAGLTVVCAGVLPGGTWSDCLAVMRRPVTRGAAQ